MSKCFAILWVPTVHHLPIPFERPINNGSKEVNISDDEKEPFMVRVKTKGKDIDIFVQRKGNPNEFELFITLQYEDFSHNGMIKYSFEPKFLDNGEFGFDDTNFPEIVYHIIKGFYHIHEFHEDETDSSLIPFLSCKDINIHLNDNLAIQHYLKNHEKNVLTLVDFAKTYLRLVIDKEKHDPEFVLKDFDTFLKMYVMVLGYDTYIHSLYKSVYNKKCRISNEKEREMRRCAFNIENSVRYYNVLYVFFDTKIRNNNVTTILRRSEKSLNSIGETLDTAKRSLQTSEKTLKNSLINIAKTESSAKTSTKWARYGIILSFILGIGSILYSIRLSNDSSKELQEVGTTLRNSIEPLNKSLERNGQLLDSLLKIGQHRSDNTRTIDSKASKQDELSSIQSK